MKATLLILASLAVKAAADETIRDLFEHRKLPGGPACTSPTDTTTYAFSDTFTQTSSTAADFFKYGNTALQVPGAVLSSTNHASFFNSEHHCQSGTFKKGNVQYLFDAFCFKAIGQNAGGCDAGYEAYLTSKGYTNISPSDYHCDASPNSGQDNNGCALNSPSPGPATWQSTNNACAELQAVYNAQYIGGSPNSLYDPNLNLNTCCTCTGTPPVTPPTCPETEAGGFCKLAAQCVDTPGTTPPKTCAANTAFKCDTDGEVCCKCTTGGAFQDPWMVGLNGQTFLFDGQDGTWYAFLHDPSTRVNMRIYEPENVKNDETVTYIDGMGLVVEGEDGEEHRIAVIVKDGNNFHPTCSHGTTCLANGALEIEIDGVKVTSPGHHLIDEETWVGAYNSPLDCKLIPRAHSQWEEVEAAMREKKEKKVQRGRRLLVLQPEIDILDALLDNTFDPAKCAEWRALRAHKRDIFSMKDKHSTIMIQTSKFTMRLEYTMSDTPLKMNNGRFELKEHQRLDVTMYGYKTPNGKDGKPLATGVIGETSVIKFDDVLGTPLLKGRDDVLSGADVDYEVAGPYASEFKAKSRTDLRKLF